MWYHIFDSQRDGGRSHGDDECRRFFCWVSIGPDGGTSSLGHLVGEGLWSWILRQGSSGRHPLSVLRRVTSFPTSYNTCDILEETPVVGLSKSSRLSSEASIKEHPKAE